VLDAIYRYHSEHRGTGTARWGDKTPLNTRFLPEIARVFPSGRFVHMLRDGCDVVFSLLEMGRYDTVERAAMRWRTAVSAARSFSAGHPGSTLEVRYEELVEYPERTVREICSWLGLEFSATMLEAASSTVGGDIGALAHHGRALEAVDGSSIGRGRAGFDAATRDQLQRLIGPMLASTGYPPATA
jgi:hypothetical protein